MSLQLLFAVAPMALVVVLIVGLRQPAHLSSLAGLVATLTAMLLIPAFRVPASAIGPTAATTALLLANAVWVMFAGVYLNRILESRGVQARLAQWITALPLPRNEKITLIVVGVAPAVESMTGFGVSLFVTLPVLLALSPRAIALRQSMLSVNIMPWGTLGLATIVGAALSHYSLPELGTASAIVSFLVFPAFAMIAVRITGPDKRSVVHAAAIGLLFSTVLLITNHVGLVEIAGVLTGFLTAIVMLLLHRLRFPADSYPSIPWSSLAPYGCTLGLILCLRLLAATGAVDLGTFTISSGNSSFNPVTSPGFALLVTAFFIQRGRFTAGPAIACLHQLRRPVSALACFIAMAQVMNVTGMVEIIGQSVAAGGRAGTLFASPALAMVSGFLTSSNLGANALMMPLQTAFSSGAEDAGTLLFAAMQNSGAGHSVFTSLPNILLILMIARSNDSSNEEAALLKFGMTTAILVYTLILAGAFALSMIMA